MWRMINLFFFRKTINNWGMPWHLILSWLGMAILQKVLPVSWTVVIVFLSGLIYELKQLSGSVKYRRLKQRRDSFEDMIANMFGILFGYLL